MGQTGRETPTRRLSVPHARVHPRFLLQASMRMAGGLGLVSAYPPIGSPPSDLTRLRLTGLLTQTLSTCCVFSINKDVYDRLQSWRINQQQNWSLYTHQAAPRMRLACEVWHHFSLHRESSSVASNHQSRLTGCFHSSNQNKDKVIFKSVRHFRLQNELEVLLRFQSKTPYIRPLLEEIEEPPAIILRYLEDDLLQSSNRKRLSRPEVKFVARRVLDALNVLHSEGFVHTGN